MKKLNKTIIFSLLLLISMASTIFMFVRVRDLKAQLNATLQDKKKAQAPVSRHPLLDHYLVIDSLLAKEKYNEARLAYEKLLDRFPKDKALVRSIKLRIRDLVKFDKMQQKLRSYERENTFEELSSKMQQVDSLSQKLTTFEQMHHNRLDSVNFALKKANILTESLKNQLNSKLSSTYLSFTNQEGVKIHYVGNVKDKKAHGQGFGLYSNGNRYKGTWKNNKPHGEGTLYWSDGEYYQGSFQSGQRQGQGNYYWPNGDKFAGVWKDDKRNGQGIFYKKNGKIAANGLWKNNKFIKKRE